MKKWQANLGLLTVAIIWGGSFVATDYLQRFITPLNVQTSRNVLASIILIIVFRKKFFSAKKYAIILGASLGVLFFTANLMQSIGLLYTTVSKNAFLTANYAIFIPILSWVLFKKPPTKFVIYGLLLMMFGYFYIIFDIEVFNISSYQAVAKQLTINKGDLFTVICALLFAFHIIVVSRFIKDQDPIQVLIFQSIFAAILGMSLIFITKESIQIDVMKDNFIKIAFPLLYMTVFSSILCFGGQLIFQKYTDSASAGILMSLESAFAALFAVIIGVDDFYSGLAFGGFFVLLGVITAETNLSFLPLNKTVQPE